MSNHPERTESRKVTIEELLRLKRAERPSPEFWTRFEEELRAKQLAAIVEKRPWWISLRLPQAARGLARVQVPLGAAAVLALSFVAVREYRPLRTTPEMNVPVVTSAVLNERSSVDGDTPVAPTLAPVAVLVANTEAKPVVPASAMQDVAADTALDSSGPGSVDAGGLTAMIPWGASHDSTVGAPSSPVVPLGELTAVSFASAINPERDYHFEGGVEFEPIMTVAASTIGGDHTDAPAQVSPVSPREVRRNRILSTLVVAENSAEGDRTRFTHVREVLTSSLDEDRLYDSVRRVGMGGDRLTLKF